MTHVYFVRHAQPNYENHDDFFRELSPQGLADRALALRNLSESGLSCRGSSALTLRNGSALELRHMTCLPNRLKRCIVSTLEKSVFTDFQTDKVQ